ncbi:MAG: hypothetical protein ACYC26_10485 [Phycisphaerales bacterium]
MPIKRQNNEAILPFSDDRPRVGEVLPISSIEHGFRLHFEHLHGQLFQGDSIEWLSSLPAESADLVFADPPYNVNKAEWDNFASQEAYIRWRYNRKLWMTE